MNDQQKNNIYSYNVNIKQTLISEERSLERYGRWNKVYENEYINITKDDEYPNVLSDINLKEKEGYLLWAEYNNADSFGKAENEGIEIIGILKNKKTLKY